MINEFYKDMTGKGSVIRQFFDYANKKGAEIGMENIYNFSNFNIHSPNSCIIRKSFTFDGF